MRSDTDDNPPRAIVHIDVSKYSSESTIIIAPHIIKTSGCIFYHPYD